MKEKVPREMWCMFLVYKSFSCCHLLDRSENILRVAISNVLKSLLDLIHLDEWPQMSVMSTQKGLPKGNKQQMRIIKLNWHFRIEMLCNIAYVMKPLRVGASSSFETFCKIRDAHWCSSAVLFIWIDPIFLSPSAVVCTCLVHYYWIRIIK